MHCYTDLTLLGFCQSCVHNNNVWYVYAWCPAMTDAYYPPPLYSVLHTRPFLRTTEPGCGPEIVLKR